MKKRMIVILISVLLFVLAIPSAFAEEDFQIDFNTEMTDEAREMLRELDLSHMKLWLEVYKPKIDYKNIVKVHYPSTSKVMTEYAKKKSLSKLIGDSYTWWIPTSSEAGEEAIIVTPNNDSTIKWTALMTMNIEEGSPYSQLFNKDEIAKEIPENTTYKVVQFPNHYGAAVVVYYVHNGVEHMIPYDVNYHIMPLKVKQDYQVDTLMKEWSEKYKEVKDTNNGAGGGGEYKLVERDGREFEWSSWMTISIILAIVIGGGLVGFIVFRKRKRAE